MKKIIDQIHSIVKKGLEISVPFLCLGIVLSLIVGDNLFGWDPVGNITKIGTENLIGLAALLVLYSQISKK